MAKKSTQPTTLKEIEESLFTEGVAFLQHFQKRHSDETIYSFLFELSEVGYAAAAAIATEEALTRNAEELAEDFDDDIDQARKELRWAGTENGFYQSEDKQFRQTNKLLDAAERTELYPEYDGTLEESALSVIQRMVDEGIFGDAAARDRIIVGICHTGGDNSQEKFIQWASGVNTPKALKRLKAELK